MSDCLFCKIVDKTIGAIVVYEDQNTVAFLDIHPKAPGHTMVIPKAHATKLGDVPDSEVGPLFAAVKNVAGTIEKSLAPQGFTIGINQGKAAGQAVDHLHVHIIPRFTNDGGGSVHSIVNNPPKETLEEIAGKIKQAN